MPLNETLTKTFGLHENETAIYLACLQLGQGTVQDIAKASGITRTNIYNYLDGMKEKGLLIETKKQKRYIYTAIPPERLLALYKSRETTLEDALPELKALQNEPKNKPKVTYYEGIDRIMEVYNDQLLEAAPIYAYEDLEHMKIALPEHFYNSWPWQRAERGIPFKSISRRTDTAEAFYTHNEELLRETKALDTGDWKTEINIYGDKVAMMSFRSHPAFCVVIEDKNIAATLRSSWQSLWDLLPTNNS